MCGTAKPCLLIPQVRRMVGSAAQGSKLSLEGIIDPLLEEKAQINKHKKHGSQAICQECWIAFVYWPRDSQPIGIRFCIKYLN